MIYRHIRTLFSLGGVAVLVGSGCGTLLGLDEYAENAAGSGGAAGMGSGGQAGQAGEGGAPTECMPQETAPCYDGPMGTQNTGVCKSGTKTCGADGKYGPCLDAIVPSLENCALPSDEDCNGSTADCTGSATWSVAYGSAASGQFGASVKGMTDGSVVVSGDYTDTFAFGNCGMVSTSGTSLNIFLAKLDVDGTCQFVKEFGDNIGYDYGYDVAVAKNDDIVLTGGFTSMAINFGGGVLAAQGSNDAFVARFDKMGNHLWSKRYGDNKDQLANSVGLDAKDNIFVAGDFGGTLDFGSGISVTVSSPGQTAGFIAKLDATGTALYGHSFGVAANPGDFVLGTRVAVDAQGNATIVGRFRGTLDVGGTMLTSIVAADTFVIRYAADGTLLYAKKFGATEDEWNLSVATAPDGSVYISGKTLGTTLDLGSFVINKTIPGAGGGDIFLIKLNPDGSFADGKVFGDAMDQTATSVAVDPLGHVILGGTYTGQVDFGKGLLPTAMVKTLFVAKFDTNLNALWSKPFYSNKAESNINLGTDPSANILMTGGFSGALQVELVKPLPQQGNGDIFVAKLAP